MAQLPGNDDDDAPAITLRISRRALGALSALVTAFLLHVTVLGSVSLLPEPKPKPKRVEMTVVKKPPPPPPPAMSPEPPPPPPPPPPRAKEKKQPEAAPPPSTSPVAPELPPSESPPENRARLPVVEVSPTPAPPPQPGWKNRLRDALGPPPKVTSPTGPLAPSFRTLDRVALSDAKLFDEQTERRIQQQFGPFLQRGIDALRGNWHPDDVLATGGRDPSKLCGKQTRTTYAVAVLNKQGTVVDVDLKNPSGCPQLDTEAIAAFMRVAIFPHPPENMFIAPDGTPTETTRFPVRFIVSFDGGVSLDWR